MRAASRALIGAVLLSVCVGLPAVAAGADKTQAAVVGGLIREHVNKAKSGPQRRAFLRSRQNQVTARFTAYLAPYPTHGLSMSEAPGSLQTHVQAMNQHHMKNKDEIHARQRWNAPATPTGSVQVKGTITRRYVKPSSLRRLYRKARRLDVIADLPVGTQITVAGKALEVTKQQSMAQGKVTLREVKRRRVAHDPSAARPSLRRFDRLYVSSHEVTFDID